jgi:DNA primase
MIPPSLNLRRLKQTVTIEQVLSDEGLLDRFRRRGSRLVGPCPLHGGDNPTAFTVDLDRNIWHCFTGCNGGDLVELARRLSDGTFAGAARYLARLEGTAPAPAPFAAPHHEHQPFRPFTRRLLLDPSAAFLASKGITPQTARRYEVGAYRGPGMLSGCIGLRLLDVDGNPLGYAGRRLDPLQISSRGKWVFPPRLPKSTLLYGYHQARPLLHRGAVVVECPWGALRITQLGIPTVALLGTSISPRQSALLANLQRVVLLLDGDRAGRHATALIKGQLANAGAAHLPDDLDPDDLSDQELRHVLAQASPLPF